MKKIVKILIVSVLTLTLLVGFTGCKGNGISDEQAEASAIYKDTADAVWKLLGKDNPTKARTVLTGLTIPNRTHEESGESIKQSYVHNLSVMTLYVNFLGDLLANEEFVYTDKVVEFSVSASAMGESISYDIALSHRIDKENGNVYSEFVLTAPNVQGGVLYMLMDIGYDFENKIADRFRLIYYNEYSQNNETVKFLNDQIYTSEGKCFINTNYEDYELEMQAFVADFAQRKANGIKLDANFNEEYQTMMDLSASLA